MFKSIISKFECVKCLYLYIFFSNKDNFKYDLEEKISKFLEFYFTTTYVYKLINYFNIL